MKILIVGIDGLGRESLDALRLTRLEARLKAGSLVNSKVEHRISRGWPEIYSGETAWTSGCFYQIPVKTPSGRLVPSQKTAQSTAEAHVGRGNMLWHRLMALGLTVGVFTVPTVSIPFETEGFFVAGSGGGEFGSGFSEDALYPRTLLRHAQIADLDLGLRMGYGAYLPKSLMDFETKAVKHLSDFFFTLGVAIERRPSDVVFLGSRFVTELAYKFIELLQSSPTDSEARAQKELVLALAQRFDMMLDDFIEDAGADDIFIVSDHGIGRLVKEFNINEGLVDLGILARDPIRNLARHGNHAVRRLRRSSSPEVAESYRLAAAEAFSIGYIDALYVNDARFTGPQMSAEVRHETATRLSRILNDWVRDVAQTPEIRFEPTRAIDYASKLEGADVAKRIPLPDIRAFAPKGYVNEKKTSGFIASRKTYFGQSLYIRGFPGEYSGTKTDDTLTGYVGPHHELVKQGRLTDLYVSILAVAEALA